MDSEYFQTRYSPDPSRHAVWKAICEYLQRYVPRGSSILEIGPGYCDFINQIQAAKRYAMDANADVSRYCAQNVTFIQGRIPEDLSFEEHSIDVVFASNFLEHLSDERSCALFERLNLLIKDGGKLILIQPNYYYCYRRYWDDFTHVKAFSDVTLTDYVLSKGYKILKLEKKFLPLSFKSPLPKSYWLTKLYLSSIYRPMAKQMLLVAQR